MSFASLSLKSLMVDIHELRKSKVTSGLFHANRLLNGTVSRDSQPATLVRQLLRRKIKKNVLIPGDRDPLVVPLSWAATSRVRPFANLGDALSPIMVSALSGLPTEHQHFDSSLERLACIGTIGHGLKNGVIHFWGTGIDKRKNPVDRSLTYYQRPPNTTIYVHALRGPLSAQVFKQEGIDVPDVYGDPIWFLPSIIAPSETKRYELGIVVHISELADFTDTASTHEQFIRYNIPDALAADIGIITTLTQPTFDAIEERVKAITSCKRIASTSLHGLVIAETYGIPCVYFRPVEDGVAFPQLEEESDLMDHRMRDFYSGMGLKQLFTYGKLRTEATDWEDLIRAIDTHWIPINWSPDAFLDAFPLPLAFNPLQEKIQGDRSLLQHIPL